MKIEVLTLFPEMIGPVVHASIVGRAIENGILSIDVIDIREHTRDKHNKADDYTFGGGAGMLMMAEPVFNALRSVGAEAKRILYMSPKGQLLDQEMVESFSNEQDLVILCGHYEGIDQRVIDYWQIEEVSIGDYILTGGELPALVLIDAVARMLPDVLGSSESHNEESIYSGLLEYPQYTKPRTYEGLSVPDVLLSGNHKMIRLWRFEESLKITKFRRPDLFRKYAAGANGLAKDEKKILDKIMAGPENGK